MESKGPLPSHFPYPQESHHSIFVMHLSVVCQEDGLPEEGERWARTWLEFSTPRL